jgi:hypothetical protein
MLRRLGIGAFLLGLLACSTAAKSDDGPTASSASAIIDGEPSTVAQNFVVQLVRPAGDDEAYVCSGSLVAPNLILTARHCVSETPDVSFSCTGDGVGTDGGNIGADFTPSSIQVFVGTNEPVDLEAPDAVGSQILHDDGTSICDHDLALLIIDPPLTGIPLAALNLDTAPTSGELITSVGWGITADGGSPAVRLQRTGVPILAIAGGEADGFVVGQNEFDVGVDICEGDSGGPALDPENAIIGVVSRGGNGSNSASTNLAASCVGEGTTNVYTAIGGFRDIILSAFSAAGATATVVEIPMGISCANSSQCTSGLCAALGTSPDDVCTQSCATEACPSGFRCDRDAGDTPLCEAAPSAGGGCAVATPEHSPGEGLGGAAALALVACALVTGARRKRSQLR